MTVRIARFAGLVLLLAIAFSSGVAWRTWAGAKKKDARKPLYYVDPMHPWYKSDKPGIAPDCGMKLEPVYEDAAKPKEDRKPIYYRDPKQPGYRADAPGINPETGNDLEPVFEEAPAGAVTVAADKHELLGLTFGTVERVARNASIRSTGRIAVDETRVERVHSKTEGWIEKTFVNYTGELVRKGQPLLTLYSPELLASQRELLLALQARETMHHSTVDALRGGGTSLVEAARRRLELWDLSPEQIAEIERTGQPVKSITVYSPASGYVTEREAFPNQRINPEMKLYTIADLSRVWVMADVYEADAQAVRLGMPAQVVVPGTGRTLSARVTYILPTVDPATRTLKARLEAANPAYQLKPDMWVEVDFHISGPTMLSVPAEAVIDSGTAQVVYVDRGDGRLEPRRVESGARIEDRMEIVKGLKEGERIVTSGAFLLNSESQMRSVGAPASEPVAPRATDHGAHQHD
jgi:RND family efflux transporter MFP subunit